MRAGAGAAAFACVLAAREARAWTVHASVSLDAPCPAAPTALVVAGEAAEMDCRESDASEARCAVVARYTLRNPTASPLAVALTGDRHATLEADGVAPGAQIELSVPAGAERVVTLRAEVRDDVSSGSRWQWWRVADDTLGRMHPLFGEEIGSAVRVSIDYRRAAHCQGAGRWASTGPTTLRTRVPPGWRPTQGWEQSGLCALTREGLACTQMEEDAAHPAVSMQVERRSPGDARSGGVAIGLAGGTRRGFVGRLGYEFGLGRRIVGAVTGEFATSGDVALVPSAAWAIDLWYVSSWRDWYLPSALLLGLGAPVRVHPNLLGAARAQATLLWISYGLDVAVDWWPREAVVDVTVGLRLGL